jgi:hypothetical protein
VTGVQTCALPISVTVNEEAIAVVQEDLMDIDGRRSDRRAPITGGKQ